MKLINSCRNTLHPFQNIRKCCSSSTWFCLQTKHVLSSTGMGTLPISYFPVCIRVELEETQFWSLSQFWELLAENRKAVLPRMRGEGKTGHPLLLVFRAPPDRATDRLSAPQEYQFKVSQSAGMATQMKLEVIWTGNRIATRVL